MNRADFWRERYKYNEWANNRVLDCAAPLGDEEFTRPREGTAYGSLAKDFQHLIDAQMWWESVMDGRPTPTEDDAAPTTKVVETLRERFAASHAGLKRICESLDDKMLDGRATFAARSGDEIGYPRWQMLEHLAGHGNQHRGEIGMVLFKLDCSPGDIDFLDYIDAITGGPP